MTSNALLTRLGGVDLLSWNPLRTIEGEAGSRLVNNFGDLLGPLLVELILGSRLRSTPSLPFNEPPVLVAIGSVLHFAPPSATIWGTGVNFKLKHKLPEHLSTLDFRSVRGPHSARAITAHGGTVPAVFGDPALLLPRYMPELRAWSRRGDGGLLIAPNLNDYADMAAAATADGHAVVDPRGPLKQVLRTIAESGFVIGSSLHAIAIADALGIPARFIASPTEGPHKYRDYLAGTGRPLAKIAVDIERAIELGGHSAIDVDLDALLDSFPYELWDRNPRVVPATSFSDRASIIGAWKEATPLALPDGPANQHHFVHDLYPAVLASGRATIVSETTEPSAGARSAFESDFAEASEFRAALAPELSDDADSAIDQALLASLDSGSPDRFLRNLWLDREGAHALLRSSKVTDDLEIFSIALRPGTMTNNLTGISVVAVDASGGERTTEVPVFAMYSRQWSLDLSASFDVIPGATAVSLFVRLHTEEGAATELPVMHVPSHLITLSSYPAVSDAPHWRVLGTELRPQGEVEAEHA